MTLTGPGSKVAHANPPGVATASASIPERAPSASLAREQFALSIRLNRTETGQVLPVTRQEGRWTMSREDLRRLPIEPPQGWASLPADVPLDASLGIEVAFDALEQRLDLTVPVDWLAAGLTRVGTANVAALASPTAGPAGLVLNYDIALTHGRDRGGPGSRTEQFAATSEARWFDRGAGVLSQTQLHRIGRTSFDGAWHASTVRLDTQWRLSQPAQLLQWRLGDGVTEGGPGLRAIRFGGFQVGTDFGLQPQLSTTVLPAYFGSVALPSTVDLYIDGIRRHRGEVPPGPFSLDTIPGISGSGQATVVVTDALGRSQTIAFPFYASTRLLQPGLSRWSLSTGVARLRYGMESFSYDEQPFASGRWRQGLTQTLTLENAAEITRGQFTLGTTAVWAPGQIGVFSPRLALSESRLDGSGRGRHGMQFGLGYEWSNRRLALQAETVRTGGSYRDVASRFGTPWPRRTDRIGVGYAMGISGSLGLNWIQQQEQGGADSRFLSLGWSRSVGYAWGINLSLARSLGATRQTLAYLGVTRSFGPGQTASMNAISQSGRDEVSVGMSQAMTLDNRRSWRVQASLGDNDPMLQAEMAREWQSFRAQANFHARGTSLFGWLGGQGAVAWMEGRLMTARAIPDAFALVSTDGVGDVAVQLDNRDLGRTDRDGYLLVAPLHGWMSNRVTIDALALPADFTIESPRHDVVARGLAGIHVRFPMRRVRAASVVIVDSQGTPLAAGTSLAVHRPSGTVSAAIIGYDGEVWLEDLEANGNRLERAGGAGPACTLTFDFPDDLPSPARLGPFTCSTVTKENT